MAALVKCNLVGLVMAVLMVNYNVITTLGQSLIDADHINETEV